MSRILLPTHGCAFLTASSVSMMFGLPMIAAKLRDALEALGERLYPATKIFYSILTLLIARRNCVF
jgi:hypothetical protein